MRNTYLGMWAAGLTAFSLAVSGCGDGNLLKNSLQAKTGGSGGDSADAGGKVGTMSDKVVPPAEYYDALLKNQLDAMHQRPLGAGHVLYLNFGGATLDKGVRTGQSFLLCAANASIPAAAVSPAEQEEIATRVQAYFTEARAALTVTLQKPASGDFTTIIVGGTYADLGCPKNEALAGIAPFDQGNLNDADIAFVFTNGNPTAQLLAVNVAHEAGHTYGLDHVDNTRCIMASVAAIEAEGFRTGKIVGGEQTQDAAAALRLVLGETGGASPNPNPGPNPVPPVPGIDIIAELGKLIDALVKDPQLHALLEALLQQLGPLLPGVVNGLPGMDKIMAALTLILSTIDPNNPGNITPDVIVNLVMQLIQQLTGQNLPPIPGLDQLINLIKGGNVDVNAIIQTIISLLNGISTHGNGASFMLAHGTTPDLAKFIGVDGIQSTQEMLAVMKQQRDYINSKYTGQTREALLSLLKAAHMQAFARLN